jgi:hypothetical protein
VGVTEECVVAKLDKQRASVRRYFYEDVTSGGSMDHEAAVNLMGETVAAAVFSHITSPEAQ